MMNIRESERERTEERWGQKEMRRQWKRSNRIYYLADSMSSESYDHDTQYNTLADSKIRLERERVCVCVCGGCFYQPSIGDGEQENIPIEEVFAQLRCTKEGLTTDEGNNRLAIFGSNKLEEKVVQSTNSSFLCHFIFCFFCWASRRSFKQMIQDVKISPL
jgi:hypothetical protein